MEIIVAKSAGFCFGVKNAVDTALQTTQHACTLGEIIHNEIVVERLKQKGIEVVESLEDYRCGDIIIRSHGVGRDVLENINKRGINIIDATCPFVTRIHQIVKDYYEKGFQIIIIGEAGHPEVIGTNGWCDYTAIIIESLDEAKKLKNLQKNCCVVCQTTFSYENYKIIALFLKNACKIVEIFDTICYTTKDRQQEAVMLAKSCDCMLVIGSAKSSNTNKLYDLCKQYCKNTYLITTLSDLEEVNKKNTRLGITAGASTPKELIEEVVNIMSESQEMSKEMLNEEIAEVANQEVKNEFEKAMESQKEIVIKPGKKLEVTVISTDKSGIKVNYGGKHDAFIDKSEVEINEEDFNPDNYQTGSTFIAEFIEKAKKGDMIAMSRKAIAIREKEAKDCEKVIKGGDFTVKIEKAVKGGLLSKMGPFTIFVPQSQIRMGFENDLEKYVAKDMKLRLIVGKKEEENDDNKTMGKRIVASHRVIIEEEREAREEAFWSKMIVGEIVKGKVKRFAKFGAFVSVNGNDCLAHVSDLSWVKVNDPSEVLELNKTYDFVILSADRETGKVSLGYKQLQKKPYDEAVEKYPVGTIVNGKAERVFDYGAFVSIDKGVDGLVPVSEISHSYVRDAKEIIKAGQDIEAQVIKFDGNKITLSIKALLPIPEAPVRDVVITNEDIKENNEKRAKANARKFDNIPQQQKRKPSAKRVDNRDDEVKSWTTETSGATFGDLFKGLDFGFNKNDEE